MKITSLCRPLLIPALCLTLTGLGGCAALDQRVGLTYARNDGSPVRHSGAVTVTRAAPRAAAKNSRGEWIVGSLNNVHGVHQADLLAVRSPEEWVTDALLHELRLAGYTVNYADTLPASTAHAIVLTGVTVFLTVNKGAVTADMRHELKFNTEFFLNGDKVKTLTVASRDDKTVAFDASREEKEGLMLQSLRDAMQQIIPDISALLDKK
jgi:hypothetical protein